MELEEAGVIAASVEVRIEIHRQDDDLAGWAKARNGVLLHPNRALLERVAEISNAFRGLIKPNSTKSSADPFVVALAKNNGEPVVTYGTRAKKDAAPRFPNVCESLGVDCIPLVDVLRAEGLKPW